MKKRVVKTRKRKPRGTIAKKQVFPRPHVTNSESRGLQVRAIECPKCADVIYSRARHDYRECKCGEVAIDGGFDYQRVIFKKDQPKTLEVWVAVSIKDLYQDWATRTDKYGRVLKEKADGQIVR